jgi:hypothetical protein
MFINIINIKKFKMNTYTSLANLLGHPSSPMLIPTSPPNSPSPIFRLPPPAPSRPMRPKYRVCHVSDKFRAASRQLFQDQIFKPRSGEITRERMTAELMNSDITLDVLKRFICYECGYKGPKCYWKTSSQDTCDVVECPVCGVYSPEDEDWIVTQ